MVSEEIQLKVSKCFTRLYRIIKKNNISLRKVFNDFDKSKEGKLSEKQFIHMMQKLDKQMREDEIMEAFNTIDEDGSKTLQFQELNRYYCKVNGVPDDTQSGTSEPMDI